MGASGPCRSRARGPGSAEDTTITDSERCPYAFGLPGSSARLTGRYRCLPVPVTYCRVLWPGEVDFPVISCWAAAPPRKRRIARAFWHWRSHPDRTFSGVGSEGTERGGWRGRKHAF